RARLPEGQGIWPAIWMLPTDSEYGGWAASGEIDIMELVGHIPGRVHGTLHFGGEWPNNTSIGDSFKLTGGRRFSEEFHVFTLIWEPGVFRWYVDGEHYQTRKFWRTSGHDFPAPFDRRFHLLLNVAVGGNWPGTPNETTVFPQEMVVDYVRVYQAARP
ncbi:MAG: glycoside hydrolase family 16 protein, partial [Spirochaetales bacterium]